MGKVLKLIIEKLRGLSGRVRGFVCRQWASLAQYLVALVAIAAMWLYFRQSMEFYHVGDWSKLAISIGEGAFFLLPYWLLPTRWRWTIAIPVWGIALWILSNLCYYRFWNDFYSPSTIFVWGNYSSELIKMGASLFRASDWVYVIIPLIVTGISIFLQRKAKQKYSVKVKIGGILMSLIAIFLGQYNYFWIDRNYPFEKQHHQNISVRGHYFGDSTFKATRISETNFVGLSGDFPRTVYELLTSHISLKQEDKELISTHISFYSKKDGLVGDTLQANVVYIIVESLNNDALFLEFDNQMVTPTLDSLAVDQGTIFFPDVVSQIKYSASSDGHLLLLTGLMPPANCCYTYYYGASNRYPSLMKALNNHQNLMVLADDGGCWNETAVLNNFGFDRIVSNRDYDYRQGDMYADEAMFTEASRQLSQMKHPFFLGLMTISTHFPFHVVGKMPEFIKNSSLPETEKRYLTTVNQFDSQLNKFLKTLPENTIVFIASDHYIYEVKIREEFPRGIFMALHTSRTERINRWVGQASLFPAALDILGVDHPDGYRGVVPSALNPTVNGTLNAYGSIYGSPTKETIDTLRQAYNVSDLIHRGDYFKAVNSWK